MIGNRWKSSLAVVALTAIATLASASGTLAANGPIKQVIVNRIGEKVNKTTNGGICTVASKDVCQPAQASSEPGGFEFMKGVAGGPLPEGNVYVADGGNNRVQEFTKSGEFVLMFGKHVNATTGSDTCTETEVSTEGVKCQKGMSGGEAGALDGPSAVAVDPSSGNVYVAEPAPENTRVDEYTSAGKFVLMIGRDVNQTKKTNLCTENEVQNESVKCQAGTFSGFGGSTPEPGAFVDPVVAAAGPNHVLYVGDQHSVQEFNQEGKWIAEIREPLEHISSEERASVSRLAVDPAGDVYLVYEVGFQDATILEFDSTGKEIDEFAAPPDVSLFIIAIAVDPEGRLAVIENESNNLRGLLYEVETAAKRLHVISEFPAQGVEGIAFNGNNEMFAAASSELITYAPLSVGQLTIVEPTTSTCEPGSERETDITLNCELEGTVDPWGVKETEVWFEWGRTAALGETTPKLPISAHLSEGEEEPPVSVAAPITEVRPNETFYDRVVGEDEHVKSPELLSSLTGLFTTLSVPPRIVGQPVVWFVTPNSANLFDEINPENMNTRYEFQYANVDTCVSLEDCPGASRTMALTSSVYGKVGVMLEAGNLQPATEYRYRLYAKNQNNEAAVNQTGEPQLPEGQFTTAPTPTPGAATGLASVVGQTTATITGTVEPDGQEATYSFEMGIYSGPNTQYATVYSASAGAGSAPLEEVLLLISLQPDTTYAYRIAIKSGYINNQTHTLQGTSETFTTQPLPAGLSVPPAQQILAKPTTSFPKPPKPPAKCKSGYKLNKNSKCTRTKKVTKTKKAIVNRRAKSRKRT